MENKKDARKLPALIASIKIEPGTLGAAPGRLPSFGGRRDLTLGSCGPSRITHSSESKPRRIYTPNLNVQRNKNKVDINIKEEHPNSKEKRERRKDDGKGRKRDKLNNLIQSNGVFAEGIAGTIKKRFGGVAGEQDSTKNFIPKPKLNLQHNLKVDKEEEEMKLRVLLQDDFVDDPSMDPDADYAPVKLPMLTLANLKIELKEEVKPKLIGTEEEGGGIKIKQEIVEEGEKDVKPKVENGKIKHDKEPEITKMKKPELITVQHLLQSKERELIFMQMPDCLPGLKPETNVGQARPSTSAKQSTSVVSQSLPSDETQIPYPSRKKDDCISARSAGLQSFNLQ
ncbi:DNA-directed RNA polymerase III subunit RPC4 isoform X2 [Zootermopsis nevadensis]|uniref:DNA-directed RNA polymerase III subunit RPC4 isoform X2 n=1 Tax=Zootermopsis nevadensis TaxID=136037 RepID=UPI000B8EDC69|nr:DNA-directed RNA polymerase III subunit RPC4 isoform X2 [Zootermopsis nevadensis]